MKQTVLVVGDSIAGLTAALHLAQRGYLVTVITSHDPIADGATNELPFVFMGSDRATRSLIDSLETTPRHLDSASLMLLTTAGRLIELHRPWLPAPLHTMASIALFSGWSIQDRWRLLTWMERTWEHDPALPMDLDSHTAEAWLRGIGQSERARNQVWSPLARFLLGQEIQCLSAASLLNELTRCFLSNRSSSHVIVPRYSFKDLLEAPLRAWLSRLGVTFRTEGLDRLTFDASGVTGVHSREGTHLIADRYVLALPHHLLPPLLPERILTKFSYFQQISELNDSPALVVTLRMKPLRYRSRLIVLAGGVFHWLCLKAEGGEKETMISLVAHGPSQTLEQSDTWLREKAMAILGEVFPRMPQHTIRKQMIGRIQRARLVHKPGAAAHRPLHQSPFANLLLAGSWIDTGLPSNLESAIISGVRCAELIK